MSLGYAPEGTIACNGYAFPRTGFSPATVATLFVLLDAYRPTAKAMDNFVEGLHFGSRCNDNHRLLIAIESACTEETYLKNPEAWVSASYLDCLSSDHWYAFEKDYGD